jgi:metal-sulfur cluster biosynthetic enzyme
MMTDSPETPVLAADGAPAVKPPPSPETVRKALKQVKDPELNLNVIDIGLIYDVQVGSTGGVKVTMTLTSPGCPSGAEIMGDVKKVAGDLDGVTSVEVELVWEPYWTPEKMDPRVKAFLGM